MTRSPRHCALAVAAIALITFLPASAARAADLLPDLVAPVPTNPAVGVSTLADGHDHLLVRFDGYIHNVGDGALEIFGSNPVNGVMTVSGQRIYTTTGSTRDDTSRHPQIYFENSDGHNHWHLRGAARFSLWNEAGTAEVAAGAKVGFCLEDVDRIDSFAPANPSYTDFCAKNQPGVSSLVEGISRGWQDVYAAKLPFQWVDLSDVAPGRYRPGEQVDPDNFVIESNEADNGPTLAPEIVTVPGYVAASGAVTAAHPQTIVLGAAQVGSPGPYAFRIESAPKHGTLELTGGNRPPRPAGRVHAEARLRGHRHLHLLGARHVQPVSASPPGRSRDPDGPADRRRVVEQASPPDATCGSPRHGRLLYLRARAKKTGTLRIRLRKGKRRLGSCTKHARAKHRFRCTVKLRRHASVGRAKVAVTLYVSGKPAAVDTLRVPRRVHRT